jgi:hypothetical protein
MFCGVDMGQEHNIKDIKVTYRSEGPNIKWSYLKKLHPAIHVIRAVTLHIEEEFGTLTRGKKHTVPRKELDIRTLQESYKSAGYHKYVAGREINSKKDRAVDYATNGCLQLQKGKILRKWIDLRTFKRATSERWGGILDEDDSSDQEDDGNKP